MGKAFSINNREFNLGYITIEQLKDLAKNDLPEEAKANFRLFSLFDYMDENLTPGPDGKVSNLETAGIHLLFGGQYQVAVCLNEEGKIVLSSLNTPDIIEKGWTPIKKIEYVDDNEFIIKEYDELKREKVHKMVDTQTGHEDGFINVYSEDNYSNEPNEVKFFDDQVQNESIELEYYDPPENKHLKKMTEKIVQYNEKKEVTGVKYRITEPIYDEEWKRTGTNIKETTEPVESGKHIDIDG